MKISLIIHTASPDDFLRPQGIPSYFEALVENLTHQTFKQFELIYVDTYYAENRAHFRTVTGIPIKHVPVHKDHRYWYDRGNCYIAAAKNTGILYADGDLCVSCDDAEFFPPLFLDRYWYYYARHGVYMHALHKRFRSLLIADGKLVMPPIGDEYVNDHRWEHLTDGKRRHQYGTWCFAGTSFSLGDALTLNGFNERMDGCKSLEDCEFGLRLNLLGRSFAMDAYGYLLILDHGSYSADLSGSKRPDEDQSTLQATEQAPVLRKQIENLIAVENYSFCRCATELLDIVANKNPLTDDHWRIIQEATIQYRHFDPLAAENAEKLAIWKQTPTFNLVQQREELRQSQEWSDLCHSKP